MTHIIGFCEGSWEYFEKFMNFFHGREYANGKAKVRARVIIPIHFGINECGKEEFLADLKSFSTLYGNNDAPGGKIKKRFLFLSAILRKIFPKLKPITKDFEKVKCTGLRQREMEKGNHLRMEFYPIGEIKDGYYKNGREIV